MRYTNLFVMLLLITSTMAIAQGTSSQRMGSQQQSISQGAQQQTFQTIHRGSPTCPTS
jgi:hypothetical protein